MTEISSVEDSSYEPLPSLEYESSSLNQIGKIAFYSSSLIAACAFVPAFFKKKRTYTLLQGGTSLSPSPQIAMEKIDVPLEAPRIPFKVPPASPQNAEKIRELFQTIAESGVFALGANAFKLNRLGNDLRKSQVHPFEFLRCAPKECVQKIFKEGNYFKIEGVMKGVREGMEKEAKRNNLEKFLPAFAREMGKSAAPIRPLIQGRDWRAVVEYLFDVNGEHEG